MHSIAEDEVFFFSRMVGTGYPACAYPFAMKV
jgi:hypothetical protein